MRLTEMKRVTLATALVGLVAGGFEASAQFTPPQEESHHVSEAARIVGVGLRQSLDQAAGTVAGDVLAPAGKPRLQAKAPEGDTFGSLFRYEYRHFSDTDVDYNRYGLTLHGGFSLGANLPVDVAVPVDHYSFLRRDIVPGASATIFDNTRAGVVVTPRYYFLNQAKDGVDVGAGLSAFYFHTFMDDGGINDDDTLGGGPLLSVKKDFQNFTLGGGLLMERGWNMHGRPEVNDNNYIDTYKAAVNLGIPLGDRWMINTYAVYNYLDDMPDEVDNSYVSLGLGATYAIKETWSVDAGIMRDVCNSNYENLLFMVGMLWNY